MNNKIEKLKKGVQEVFNATRIEKEGKIFYLIDSSELGKLEKLLDEFFVVKSLVKRLQRENNILREGIMKINEIVGFKKK